MRTTDPSATPSSKRPWPPSPRGWPTSLGLASAPDPPVPDRPNGSGVATAEEALLPLRRPGRRPGHRGPQAGERVDIGAFLSGISSVDLLLFLYFAGFFVLGFAQGTIRRLIGLASVLFSFFFAANIAEPLGAFLGSNW